MIRLGKKAVLATSLFSVSAVSAAAVAGTLGKSTTEAQVPEQQIPESDVLLSSKGILNTKNVSRVENQPPLAILKGGCFNNFFPDVDLARPTKYAGKNAQEIVPKDFKLEQSPLLGCKLMKLSRAKQDAAFGYLSETTVQNGQYGLAFFASASNIRQQNQTYLEYWVLFLHKHENKWQLLDSGYWTLQTAMQTTGKGFSTKTPAGDEWKLKPTSGHHGTFNQFFSEGNQDQSGLWKPEDSDLFYSGIWQSENAGQHLFEEGSHEQWALGVRFDPHNSKPETMDFLKQTKFTQKGKWKTLKDYCASVGGQDSSAPSEPNKGLCPTPKAS